ncbi:unnamed protein product [Protopolystoma xenopodis]|uniref:Uncharacterized protein n=1 Tax=Protopolystoma xenopodis TaxID=117903 RepID=A0A448WMY8_9PLAT|nr:unnamed protein product [Protopolystoma xenopodis]
MVACNLGPKLTLSAPTVVQRIGDSAILAVFPACRWRDVPKLMTQASPGSYSSADPGGSG